MSTNIRPSAQVGAPMKCGLAETPMAAYENQGRSQDFEKGEANVTEGGAEGTYS